MLAGFEAKLLISLNSKMTTILNVRQALTASVVSAEYKITIFTLLYVTD